MLLRKHLCSVLIFYNFTIASKVKSEDYLKLISEVHHKRNLYTG